MIYILNSEYPVELLTVQTSKRQTVITLIILIILIILNQVTGMITC